MSERVQAIAFVTIVVLAVAGLYAAVQSLQPAAVRPLVIRHARLDVQGEGWSIRYDPVATSNNTAFGILREASATLGISLTYVPYEIPKGVFVTGINGSMNGDGGRYWRALGAGAPWNLSPGPPGLPARAPGPSTCSA